MLKQYSIQQKYLTTDLNEPGRLTNFFLIKLRGKTKAYIYSRDLSDHLLKNPQ